MSEQETDGLDPDRARKIAEECYGDGLQETAMQSSGLACMIAKRVNHLQVLRGISGGGIGNPTRVAATRLRVSEISPYSPLPASSRNRLRCVRGGPAHPPRGAIEDVGSMVNEHREL